MKKVLTLIIVALMGVSTTLSAQSKMNISLIEVNKIEVSGRIILNIYLSDANNLSASFDNKFSQRLSWSEKKGVLKLTLKDPTTFKNKDMDSVTMNLYINKFDEIQTHSNAEVYFANNFALRSLTINTSSNSSVTAILNSEKINIDAESSSKVVISGKCNNISIRSGSRAYVNTIQTEASYVNAYAYTGSECYVRATKELALKANTSATIFHKGVANVNRITTNTFGKIEQF